MLILVLDDDAETRRTLVEQLGRLFPRARVVAAATDAGLEAIEDAGQSVVLTGLPAAERIGRRRRLPGLRVVALTREMGPDTLMKAEAAGVFATLRAPASAEGLRTVLGAIVGETG